MTSPFMPFDPKSYPSLSHDLSEQANENRQILFDCFASVEISNYPSEWWHWSYGDQGWAYRGNTERAIYGPVEPESWHGNPTDMNEEVLARYNQPTFE